MEVVLIELVRLLPLLILLHDHAFDLLIHCLPLLDVSSSACHSLKNGFLQQPLFLRAAREAGSDADAKNLPFDYCKRDCERVYECQRVRQSV